MNTEREIIDKINAFINNRNENTVFLLEKVMMIIKEARKDDDIYFLVSLIRSNNKLNGRLKELVDANIDDIRHGLYTQIKVIPFIKAYALLNNIEIYDIDDANIDLWADSDNYRMYIDELRRIPLLTPSEEKELALKYKQGDTFARKKFIESNLRLVISVAKRYLPSGIHILDLIQDGNLGLMNALDGFDPELGYRFSTYAYSWIQQAITRGICYGGRNIKITNKVACSLKKFRKVSSELAEQGITDLNEIAKVMGISIDKAKTLNLINYDTLSFSYRNDDDPNGNELGDTIADSCDLFEEITKLILSDEIEKLFVAVKLTDEEIRYTTMRFGLFGTRPMSFEEIGEKYHLTRQRIQQVVIRALNKMRKRKYTKSFLIYLDNPNESEYYKENGLFDMDAYYERTKDGYTSYDYERRKKNKAVK